MSKNAKPTVFQPSVLQTISYSSLVIKHFAEHLVLFVVTIVIVMLLSGFGRVLLLLFLFGFGFETGSHYVGPTGLELTM